MVLPLILPLLRRLLLALHHMYQMYRRYNVIVRALLLIATVLIDLGLDCGYCIRQCPNQDRMQTPPLTWRVRWRDLLSAVRCVSSGVEVRAFLVHFIPQS